MYEEDRHRRNRGGTARRSLTCDHIKKRKRTTTYAHDVTDGDRSPAWRSLFDIQLIEMVLHDAARSGKALSYAEALYHLGHNFSRPKMRAMCTALNEVDARARRQGEPGLAVLVVRASDGLPGAGWWACRG